MERASEKIVEFLEEIQNDQKEIKKDQQESHGVLVDIQKKVTPEYMDSFDGHCKSLKVGLEKEVDIFGLPQPDLTQFIQLEFSQYRTDVGDKIGQRDDDKNRRNDEKEKIRFASAIGSHKQNFSQCYFPRTCK